MPKLVLKSLKEEGILQKLAVAVTLMVIIPLLLILYFIHSEALPLLQKGSAQLTILLMVLAAVSGYILSRNIITAVIKLNKDIRTIMQENTPRKINTSEQNEINELAQHFNEITARLEKNINGLKQSKQIMQNVLLRIGNTIASVGSMENTLTLTMETLTNALNATSGTIMLLEKDKLYCMVASGINSEQQKQVEIRLGSGISGWVAKEKKPLNVSRSQHDRRFDVEVKLGFAHHSIICAPLLFKDKILGTISVHDKKTGDQFSEDDMVLLKNLATQIAIAIENNRLNEDIERSYVETISALALAVEAKDPYSRGHSKRVSEYVTKLAKHFKLDTESIRTLQDAALLHDIGKIGIKDDILLKPSALTPEEKREMHRHAIIGENILKPVHSLEKVAYLVRHHQEQVNGKGYPDGLTGAEMGLPLKILIITDAFDAMISQRPYRKVMTHQEAKKELKRYSGIYFDPKVVEVFLKIF